jgi:hypothetical protein
MAADATEYGTDVPGCLDPEAMTRIVLRPVASVRQL